MTTQDVADRFMELAKENKYDQIQDELYSQDCESIESKGGAGLGMVNAKGLAAIQEKGRKFNESVEEMHDGYAHDPIISPTHFALAMGMDVTMKGAGRVNLDELAVYEVKDGKIVKEQFFY